MSEVARLFFASGFVCALLVVLVVGQFGINPGAQKSGWVVLVLVAALTGTKAFYTLGKKLESPSHTGGNG